MKTLAMKNNKKMKEKKLVFIWNWANRKSLNLFDFFILETKNEQCK